MDLLIEPVKNMLNTSCKAAAEMIKTHQGSSEEEITVVEVEDEDYVALYVKRNGVPIYKKTIPISEGDDILEARTVLYGSLLTELVSLYAIVASLNLIDTQPARVSDPPAVTTSTTGQFEIEFNNDSENQIKLTFVPELPDNSDPL